MKEGFEWVEKFIVNVHDWSLLTETKIPIKLAMETDRKIPVCLYYPIHKCVINAISLQLFANEINFQYEVCEW